MELSSLKTSAKIHHLPMLHLVLITKANGLSEVYAKHAKQILHKAKDANLDPYLPLLEYRNTPLEYDSWGGDCDQSYQQLIGNCHPRP